MAHDVLATIGQMALRETTGLALALVCLASCGDEPPVAPTHFACSRPDEAPLPDGEGGHRCLRVGARENARTELWPLLDGLPEPRVFVRSDAAEGGDGSQARPLRALDAAVAMRPSVIVLARGAYRLTTPIAQTEALTVVGADPATAVIDVGAGFATTAALTLRSLGLRSAQTGVDDAAVRATAGATLTLDDVAIDGGATGVRCDGATLLASHLTVRGTARRDVDLSGDSRGVLRSALLRDSAGSGLSIDRARVYFFEGLVAAHGRKGIVLQGAGDAARGFGDCRRDPMGSPGANDCVTDVACLANGAVGLSVEGPRAMQLRRLMLADTRVIDATSSADGLYVSRGGEVTLDPEIMLDAQQGYGTEITDNERIGVLVDGGEMVTAPSQLSMRGSTLRRNARSGVFLQNRAVATQIDYARFEENGGAGIAAVPSARIVEIGCNGFINTRSVVMQTVDSAGNLAPLSVGDGITLSSMSGVQVVANRFEGNSRYAAVFKNATGRLDGNEGSGNRYGLGVYASPTLIVADTNRVAGREPTPPELPGIVAAP